MTVLLFCIMNRYSNKYVSTIFERLENKANTYQKDCKKINLLRDPVKKKMWKMTRSGPPCSNIGRIINELFDNNRIGFRIYCGRSSY